MTVATTTRPATYDKLLVDYMPFARKCANRLSALYGDDADEIVQDFYVDACHRWRSYDAENYKFGTWVFHVVRNVAMNRKNARKTKKRSGLAMSVYDAMDGGISPTWLSTAPSQHDYAELSDILAQLSGTRDSEALMRRAMGDELWEIANDMGISRERVRQISERERERLRKVVG
jgi:RNA polymerase sigma factor (sigma-70 family)